MNNQEKNLFSFAIHLKARRRQLGWTQTKASEEISKAGNKKITTEQYQQWEHGRCESLNFYILCRIVETFSFDDLYQVIYIAP